MMELQYSPHHHSPGGAAPHLLSPTHLHHGTALEGFSIGQIRRSLSRSPSKPARYHVSVADPVTAPTSATGSPAGFSRAAHNGTASEPPAARAKYSVRRTSHLRTAARKTSPNSPLRRALGDTTSAANATPNFAWRSSQSDEDQENMDCTEDNHRPRDASRFDEPIKLDFRKADRLLQSAKQEFASPVKSSPLKRSDGVMNLEAATGGSPSHKRRSLHGASLGSDFNVFDHGLDGAQSDSADSSEDKTPSSSSWPSPAANSPQKRGFSLRKSTLQQRTGSGRSRLFHDTARDSTLSPALTRARSRISLDSALPLRSFDFDSPTRRSFANEPPVLFAPPGQKLYQSAPKPHPLSHALTPSSSSGSVVEDLAQTAQKIASSRTSFGKKPPVSTPHTGFSKSLPIGATRPQRPSDHGTESSQSSSSQDSFATPYGYQMAKPLPQAFMSTGLISKRNRNLDVPPAALFGSVNMPDTPSKKAHINIASTPAPSVLGKASHPAHEFGTPGTPFNGRTSKFSPESFGKGVSIFGSDAGLPQLTRRGSFLSVDGDDATQSPSRQFESQSSNDDLPPTPTKSTSTTSRPQSRGKSNSLRSSLFGRRPSLAPDTFAAPAVEDVSPDERDTSFASRQEHSNGPSPHTPQESFFAPPDPSSLSISADNRPRTSFGLSTATSFPPATPTGPRGDHAFGTSIGPGHASSSYFANDVDTALSSRFAQVTTLGIGEFSQVYRVEAPLCGGGLSMSFADRSPGQRVWAVKKSRKAYAGNKDRQRKMREVKILSALRGHEHLVEFVNHWEAKNHLYIQTDFYENGNLKDFLLQTGFKGRLDDFRIWKILLELSQGIQSIHDAGFIHLDLKPANVFIDWEGVLKIGDFGMASAWPAPAGLEGEGDREYIGPEILSGRFDKPADIFALGMIMLEIAGNIVLPDNGSSWQRLRAGDMSDLPSLTWSSDSNLARDESGEPIDLAAGFSADSLVQSHAEDDDDDDDLSFLRPTIAAAVSASGSSGPLDRARDLVTPPNFMVDSDDPESLDRVVLWMIHPDPDRRPTVNSLLLAGGVQWVEFRRRAGATVYEGAWGPADDVLNSEVDDDELTVGLRLDAGTGRWKDGEGDVEMVDS